MATNYTANPDLTASTAGWGVFFGDLALASTPDGGRITYTGSGDFVSGSVRTRFNTVGVDGNAAIAVGRSYVVSGLKVRRNSPTAYGSLQLQLEDNALGNSYSYVTFTVDAVDAPVGEWVHLPNLVMGAPFDGADGWGNVSIRMYLSGLAEADWTFSGADLYWTGDTGVPAGAQLDPAFTYTTNFLDLDTSWSQDGQCSVDVHSWDFGDGNTSAEVAPYYSYAIAGTYNVTHTVTNEAQGPTSHMEVVTLTAPPDPPPAPEDPPPAPEPEPTPTYTDLNSRLRLQVASTDLGTLRNLLVNPNGDKGGYGWATPVDGSTITGTNDPDGYTGYETALLYRAVTQTPNYFMSDPVQVSPDTWVNACWDVKYVGNYYRAYVEILDSTGAVVETSAPTGYVSTLGFVRLVPTQVPATGVWARLRFDFYADTSGGTDLALGWKFSVNECMLATAQTPPAENRLPNPSFEIDLSPWSSALGGTLERTTAVSRYGTAAVCLTSDGGEDVLHLRPEDYLPTVEGEEHTFRISGRMLIGTPRTFYARLRYVDDAGTLLGSNNSASVASTSSGWAEAVTAPTVAPAGATKVGVQVYMEAATAGDVMVFDGACLSRYDNTYGDGDSGGDWTWTGTPHASASRRPGVEGLVYADTFYVWRDILGPTHEIKTNRQALDLGTLEAVVLDPDLDPAVAPEIRPGNLVRLLAGDYDTGNLSHLFEGEITNGAVTYVGGTRISLTAVDAAARLAATSRAEGVETIAEIPALLEGAGVPWIVNGNGSQVATYTPVAHNANASLLDQIAVTRDTALGYAWVDRRGTLQAWDATEIPATPVATVDEAAYSDVDVAFNTDRCVNHVTIKWLRYVPATAEDEAGTEEVVYGPFRDEDSIRDWGLHPAEFTIQGPGDSQSAAALHAGNILSANATPVRIIRSASIPIRHHEDVATGKALLDLYDPVTATYGTTTRAVRVTGVSHEITPRRWRMDLTFEDSGTVAAPQVVPSPPPPPEPEPEPDPPPPPPVVAQGYRGSAVIASNAFVRLNLDGDATDPYDFYDHTTGIYTIPEHGLYELSGSIYFNPRPGPTSHLLMVVRINGTEYARWSAPSAAPPSTGQGCGGSYPIRLTAGVQVWFEAYQDSGGNVTINNPSHMVKQIMPLP